MSDKKRYPKSFYDDGFGDILEFIDDEILIHSENKKERRTNKNENKGKRNKHGRDDGDDVNDEFLKLKKGPRKQVELYGDNDLDEVQRNTTLGKRKKVKINLDPEINDYDEIVDEDSDAPDKGDKKVDKKISDRARGLINRLAAQTMPYVAGEFEKMYSTSSRTSINDALFSNIESSIIQKSNIAKRKIVAEVMLLVSYLSHKVSNNIGASLVHYLVSKFERFYSSGASDDDKRLDNITFCLSNLYIIGLISANIMFEITRRICSPEDFRPKSAELLLIVLKNIGFQLRKDNPSLMRQLILISNDQCKQLEKSSELDTRVKFIMDALSAIKNNNISKIGNYGCDIDKDTIESTLKNLIKRIRIPETLSDATYDDIVNSANFHLLELRPDDDANEGTSLDKSNNKSGPDPRTKQFVGSKTEEKICKALGLNKPAEKTIFSALLKVTDFVEASNILIGFGMNHCSDAMVVCLHVAIFEKSYNPFYFNVINNLCKYHRKYKIAAKFALQDKIRALSGMRRARVDIFKQLCFELIKSDAVPITVLKSIEWANLDFSTKDFLTYLLTAISKLPDEERTKVMLKSDKRSTFAGAMRTFTGCFLDDVNLFQ